MGSEPVIGFSRLCWVTISYGYLLSVFWFIFSLYIIFIVVRHSDSSWSQVVLEREGEGEKYSLDQCILQMVDISFLCMINFSGCS